MSLSRNLVDLYVLASAVTKVGSNVLARQTSAVCHHVKTSSLLNPTTVTEETMQTQRATEQHTPETPIEVPFPDFVEKNAIKPVEIKKEAPAVAEMVSEAEKITPVAPVKETPIDKAQANTATETPFTVETPKPFIVETSKPTISIETPSAETIVKEAAAEIKKELKESRIPTSRFGRLWNYGTLATGMGMGAVNESFKRATGISQDNSGKK